jgi:DNA-directed RNA polymerase specialized sigma24 family protein
MIRHTITQALSKKMAAAGYEGIRLMIEDTVNETYCRLFQQDCQALRSFKCRYQNSIFAYLRTISLHMVSNQMRTYRRRHANGQLQSLEAMQENSRTQLAGSTSEVAIAGDESAEHKALEHLVHASFRVVFRDTKVNRNFIIFKLHFLHGYHGHEIARIKGLGLSERGVNVTADRIRQWLRQEDGTANAPAIKAARPRLKTRASRKHLQKMRVQHYTSQQVGRC